MTSPFVIPDAERAERRAAIAPRESIWVSANAGSGKTRLLRDRVIRLLLDGVLPDHILCLTYTKAAAAEMQERIFGELARWVSLSDEELALEIRELTGSADARYIRHARALFAQAIETPGGLKIQTIHAFAERLLHLFPMEAGVPVDFSVLDEVEASELREDARKTTLLKAAASPESRLGRAFRTILQTTRTGSFANITRDALATLRRIEARDGILGDEALDAALETLFGASPDSAESGLEDQFLAAMPSQEEALETGEAILALNPGSKTRVTGEKLLAYGRAQGRISLFEAALGINMGSEGKSVQRIIDKPTLKALPHLEGLAERLKAALDDFLGARAKLRSARRSQSLHIFAAAMLTEFQRLKTLRRVLDFEDMILILRRMLAQGQAPWVMMKLDAAIEHILVDEAQDTTPEMWDIVQALADDFFSGEGQVRRPRSLFVVGDEKQSIYSFQGAEPRIFDEMRRDFARRIAGPNRVEKPVRLNTSFRSSLDVLMCIDAVFADPERRAGLSADDVAPVHPAAKLRLPGLVECWPLEEKRPIPENTNAPIDQLSLGSPAIGMAERIASTIKGWLEGGKTHLSDGKPINPGDILILVQKRNEFFNAVLRALNERHIPVAGADRLKIQNEIGVQDLIAIASAALLPRDDLALATVLKTPIFGLDDAMIERLCRPREGCLRDEIRRLSPQIPLLAAIDQRLAALERRALIVAPHDFLAHLLVEDCPGRSDVSGRSATLKRLGADAADAIDAFLSDALDFARRHPPSLALFIAAQAGQAREIKRDLDSGQGRVRVMTVHAAKGLESPIVFLADAMSTKHSSTHPKVHPTTDRSGGMLLWAGSATDAAEPIRQASAEAKARAYEEYRRLLYVGLTRAKERLYVVGHRIGKLGKDSLPDDPPKKPVREWHWHALVHQAMRARSEVIAIPDTNDPERLPVLRWPPSQHARTESEASQKPLCWPAPDLILTPLSDEKRSDPIRPSLSSAVEPAPGSGAPRDRARQRRRGIALHRLFQSLPKAAPERWPQVARLIVMQECPDFSDPEADDLIGIVIDALGSPTLAPFLGQGSRAEVAIAGPVKLRDGGQRHVSARLDRLILGPHAVDILDFKSGSRPQSLDANPHLNQMALYRALVRGVFGQEAVRCHLYWSVSQELETLPADHLDSAFAAITST